MTTTTRLRPPDELETAAAAFEGWQDRLRKLFVAVFAPKPRLTVSEWAEGHRVLSLGAEPGPWRTDRVPYLREIMDAVSDPSIHDMVLMKSARLGYTEGVIGNAIGFFMDARPCDVIVAQPTVEDAEDWSKKHLAAMIRDSPRLKELMGVVRSRDSSNTILSKTFPGGSLTAIGANSPRGLRRKDAKVALSDEIDAFPESAGSEGDPLKLLDKRINTHPDRKHIKGSTPTIKGLSRVEQEYERSDQRHYHVPCPHCGELQVLKWGGPDDGFGIKWDREERDGEVVHLPDTAYYLCEHCGAAIDEHEKAGMVMAGRWIAEEPGAPVAGWHVNALVSLFEGARWPQLVREWLEAQSDPDLLQVFVNTVLGEPWEERGQKVSAAGLEGRAEAWVNEAGDPIDCPDGVGVLTAAVDVQADRLEVEIEGWGAGEESWKRHHRIYGSPDRASTWARLEAMRTQTYLHGSGNRLRIACMMIDSGYETDAVYAYVEPRQEQNVFAAKGDNGRRGNAPLSRASRSNRDGVKLFTVGTFALKSRLMNRLGRARPGPGYVHFSTPTDTGTDAEYFAQYGAEKKVRRRVKGSRAVEERWVQVRDRNEAIDLGVLNQAALRALGAGVRKNLAELAEAARARKPAGRPRRRVRSKGVSV